MTGRPFPKLRIPAPYPSDWPRRIDFLTPLGLQISAKAGDLELFHCIATTTVKAGITPPSEEVPTEYGKLVKHPEYRDKLVYVKNTTLDPLRKDDRALASQVDILKDIAEAYSISYVGEFPDIIIQERGVIEKIPKAVESLPEFQGSEDLIYYQKATGNFTRKYRAALGIQRLADPFYFTRGDLWKHGIIPAGVKNHPIFKKIRSILRTFTVYTDANGWGGLGKDGITSVEKECVGRLFNLDLGLPTRIEGSVDSTSLSGQIYHLLKRDRYIALEAI